MYVVLLQDIAFALCIVFKSYERCAYSHCCFLFVYFNVLILSAFYDMQYIFYTVNSFFGLLLKYFYISLNTFVAYKRPPTSLCNSQALASFIMYISNSL